MDFAVGSRSRVEALLLQAKQAGPSALAGYAGKSAYANEGERVVAGQHVMQASSDIFLGWLRARPTGSRSRGIEYGDKHAHHRAAAGTA